MAIIMKADESIVKQLQKAMMQGNTEQFRTIYELRGQVSGINREMAGMLLEKSSIIKKIGVSQLDSTGKSLLHYAVAGNRDPGLISDLEELVGQEDKFGLTPLMLAAKMNRLQWVTALMQQECCIRDSKGRTALMYAAYASNFDILQHLFDSEWYILDNEGLSILSYLWGRSAQYEQYEALFAEKLLQWGIPIGCGATKSRSRMSEIINVRKLQDSLIARKVFAAGLKERYLAAKEVVTREQELKQLNSEAERQHELMMRLDQENHVLEERLAHIKALEKDNHNKQLQVNTLKAAKYGIMATPEIVKSAALLPPAISSNPSEENATPTSLELSSPILENIPSDTFSNNEFPHVIADSEAPKMTTAQVRRMEMQKRIRDALKMVDVM